MRSFGFLPAWHAIRAIAKGSLKPLYAVSFVLYVGLSWHLMRIGITTSLDRLAAGPSDLHGLNFYADTNRLDTHVAKGHKLQYVRCNSALAPVQA